MINNRVSLGFDLRVRPGGMKRDYPREEAFLDPRRVSLISADPSVWPMSEEAAAHLRGLLPDFLNPLYLAASLDRLINAYRGEGLSPCDLTPVCITSDPTIIFSLNKRFGVGYFEHQITETDLLSAGWQFLGFDTVDLDGLISGLKGCDYSEPIWTQLRRYYGDQLNSEGLFSDADVASRFAEVRGLEIRQHAPFVVVGILVHSFP
ncbi:MAG TPA: hypothetical protein VFW25_05985 [Silvibacterium sp.]|nr:hypothetical protein [Silvibacterium sp.]